MRRQILSGVDTLRRTAHADVSGSAVSHQWLSFYIVSLFTVGIAFSVTAKCLGSSGLKAFVSELGVGLKKLARTVKEIERKTFHAAGLLVPLIYQILLSRGWTVLECAALCWTITFAGWTSDLSRLYIPIVRDNWPLRGILREKEKHQLTGGCFFSLGCTLSINLFSPATAIASICFLVVGVSYSKFAFTFSRAIMTYAFLNFSIRF